MHVVSTKGIKNGRITVCPVNNQTLEKHLMSQPNLTDDLARAFNDVYFVKENYDVIN